MQEIFTKLGSIMGLIITFFKVPTLTLNICSNFNTDKLVETAIFAFVGGIAGALGGFIIAVIIKKVFKINIRKWD